jgi:ATP-dependent Clp protease ATP-binding subunit ClpC
MSTLHCMGAARRTSCRVVAGRRLAPARRAQALSGYAGFRRANAVDAAGQARPARTFEGAVRSSGVKGGISRNTTTMMFERFTEKAIKVVMLAQEESRRLGHNFVGTEQILLGLIGESTGIAAKVLKSMGVTLKDTRTEVEKIIGRGSGFVAVEIPFTPRAKRVLELSLDEARQLGALWRLAGS